MPRRVIIESPYAGDTLTNEKYARECMKDSLSRGESPFASHLLYTQDGVLNDNDKYERRRGIEAGYDWMRVADMVVIYVDRGLSPGMQEAIRTANSFGLPIIERRIYDATGRLYTDQGFTSRSRPWITTKSF